MAIFHCYVSSPEGTGWYKSPSIFSSLSQEIILDVKDRQRAGAKKRHGYEMTESAWCEIIPRMAYSISSSNFSALLEWTVQLDEVWNHLADQTNEPVSRVDISWFFDCSPTFPCQISASFASASASFAPSENSWDQKWATSACRSRVVKPIIDLLYQKRGMVKVSPNWFAILGMVLWPKTAMIARNPSHRCISSWLLSVHDFSEGWLNHQPVYFSYVAWWKDGWCTHGG